MLSLTRMHFEVAGCNTNIRDLQLPATASGVHKLAGGSFPCEVAAVFASDRIRRTEEERSWHICKTLFWFFLTEAVPRICRFSFRLGCLASLQHMTFIVLHT